MPVERTISSNDPEVKLSRRIQSSIRAQASKALKSCKGSYRVAANVPLIFAFRRGALLPVVDSEGFAVFQLPAPLHSDFVAIALVGLAHGGDKCCEGGFDVALKAGAPWFAFGSDGKGGKLGGHGFEEGGGSSRSR